MFSFNRTSSRTNGTAERAEPHAGMAGAEDRVGGRSAESEATKHLRALGLPPEASWEQVTDAHRRLVSDLTPGPGASHQKVQLAEEFLKEVNRAYASLRTLAVA